MNGQHLVKRTCLADRFVWQKCKAKVVLPEQFIIIVGEPVDVVVNGRIVARGEVVIVEDDNSRFGVSLTEIVGVQAKFEE